MRYVLYFKIQYMVGFDFVVYFRADGYRMEK